MNITYTTTFRCPPQALWPFLQEPERQKQWMTGLLDNQETSSPPTRPGSTFRMRIQEGRNVSDYDGEVVALDEPRHLGIRFWGGCFSTGTVMHVDYRLTKVEGGTRLDYECRMEAKKLGWFMRLLMATLFRSFGKWQLRSFMKKLKRLAEQEAAPVR